MAEAELATIARPYARAAFSSALDQEQGLPGWSQALKLLAAAVQDEKLQEALDSPLITDEIEARLLIDLLGSEATTTLKNFISLLAEYSP